MRTKPMREQRVALAKPLYSQVRDLVLNRIRSGEWKAGDALPNEYVLSSQFGVSIGTIRRAIEGLEDTGIVVRKQGRGTFVTGFASSAMAEKFSPLRDEAGRDPVPVCYQLLDIGRRSATSRETEALQGPSAREVVWIIQRLRTNKQVVGLQTSIIPAASFPRIEQQMRSGQGLYPVFASFGVLVVRVEETIGISAAHGDPARLLEVDAGTPLLEVSRRAYGHDGATVELRTSLYLSAGIRYASSIA